MTELAAVTKPRQAAALHSAATDDWGTPRGVVEFGRYVLGRIDLDPFSSAYWNHHTVKAARFYDRDQNGLAQPWSGSVHLNPPNGKAPGTDRSMVRACWDRLVEHAREGRIDGAFWVGFSLEQLTHLQGSAMHPLQFWTVVPADRLAFLQRTANNGPPTEGASPTHGNYLTLVHSTRSRSEAKAQAERFVAAAKRISPGWPSGALVRPL